MWPEIPSSAPRHIFSDDQIAPLLASADDSPYGVLVEFTLNTGLRFIEIAGLQWQDVDLRRGCIEVRRNYRETRIKHVGGEVEYLVGYGPTKTEHSQRRIQLAGGVTTALRTHRKALGTIPLPTAPVFTFSDGKLLTYGRFIATPWQGILRGAGIPQIGFHSLRHRMATRLLREGVNPLLVSKRLGHASVQITLDTYSHVLPELTEAAAEAADFRHS